MLHRRLAVFGLLVIALSGAAPAWAHEEINPATITTGKPTFFTLSAANEEKVDLVKVTITAPIGAPLGATTRTPSGWTLVSREGTAITWTAAAGQGVRPDSFETWGFETDGAVQDGTATYKVSLAYADGKTNDVDVPVTVTAEGVINACLTARQENAARGNAGQCGGPLKVDGKAGVALVLSIGALGVGAIALLVAATRRREARPMADPTSAEKW